LIIILVKKMQVKKRDGSLEAFMPEKIVVSAVKAGAPYEVAREIASSLESRHKKEEVLESPTIRKYVLTELKSRGHESVVESWEAYDQRKKSS